MNSQKGFSLIELLVAAIIIAIIAAIAIPSLLQSRRAANEASAIQTLRTISSAQASYIGTQGSNNNYGTLNQLNAAGMLDETFTGAGFTKSGYAFAHSVTTTPDRYCADAIPQGSSGIRALGIDESGLILVDLTDATPCENGILDTTGGTAL